MSISKKFVPTLLTAAVATAVTLAAASAQTQPPPATPVAPPNPCMALDQAKCPTVAGCVWLPGYKIKGGTDVQGYCRTAPKSLTSRRLGDPVAAPKQ